MPRCRREDYAGAWHHVTNRGLARRTVFETRADVAILLDSLASLRRDGLLEVHAYSVLTTHFHLLVRSPLGRISEAMHRLQNRYSRAFNRGRRRDGPLFRGRFCNRILESTSYWENVLLYIDRNPIQAALVARSVDYPHGSAWWYARREEPRWLVRTTIEAMVASWGPGGYDPAAYPVLRAEDGLGWVHALVERRLDRSPPGSDPLDDLVRASPLEVQEWMLRKASVADGTAPGIAVLPAEMLLDAVRREVPDGVDSSRSAERLRETLLVGLLRTTSGFTFAEAAGTIRRSVSASQCRLREHGRALLADPGYRALATRVIRSSLDRMAAALSSGSAIPLRSCTVPGTVQLKPSYGTFTTTSSAGAVKSPRGTKVSPA